jgi:hypothetical protein
MLAKQDEGTIKLAILASLAALLPFVTIHVSYLIAASEGHVPWCMPYWDSCTSISATGRQSPEKWWFKGMMIPAALLTALLWWRLHQWLRAAGLADRKRALSSMWILGMLAAVFLILYTLALGEQGDAFRSMRRIGVTLSFAFTFLAQLQCTHLLGMLAQRRASSRLQWWHHRLLALLGLLLTVGMLSIVMDVLPGIDYDVMEDAFEWNMALLLNLYFAGLARLFMKPFD